MLKSLTHPNRPANPIAGYGFALLFSILMIYLSVEVSDRILTTRYLFAFIAVIFSAAFGGLGPGLLSALLNVVGIDFFLIPPLYSVNFNKSDLLGGTVFTLASVVISGLVERKRQAQRELLAITDAMPAGIAYVDRDYRYRFGNKIYNNRFGVDPNVLYKRSVKEVIGDEAFEKAKPYMDRALAGEGLRVDTEIQDQNNQRLIVQADYVPAAPKRGKIPGFYVLSVDVTERRRSEEKLAALNQNLEKEVSVRVEQLRKKEEELYQARKLEAIGQLAGGVAHDFNNLITGILGISEELHNSLSPEDPRRDDVQSIIKASQRTFELTRQLLAFGRRQVVNVQVIDLNGAVNDIGKLLRRLIREDIRLEVRQGPPVFVRVDVGQLQQVLINLVVNARDAMENGGSITLDIKDVEAAPDNPGVRRAMLTVTDTGSGMTPEIQAHLFEPFYTTKDKYKGTGLGLATVYGILKQNSGDIEVSSELGKGSSFRIYLPQVPPETAQHHAAAVPRDSHGGETVLLVEDEDIVRRVVARKLNNAGYIVLEARNGREAIELAEKMPLDLIITDVIMPEMNGPDVVTRIRGLHPHVAVLYMSGYPEDVIAHSGVLQPGIDFLEKPLVTTKIVKKAREVLDKSRVYAPTH